MNRHLSPSVIVDFESPHVAALGQTLRDSGPRAGLINRCFLWVRDHIHHSADVESDVVACSASEVLQAKVALCYAKSHLLVALLRSNGVPSAFSYQRLALDGGRFCLHGLVSVHLPEWGWYRIDPRGGPRGAHALHTPPSEKLVYTPTIEGEYDLPGVYAEPLDPVVHALRKHRSMKSLLADLPDVAL